MVRIEDDLRKKRFMNYYKEIKNLIEEKEVNDKIRCLESNKETIKTYYEIGRLLTNAQGGEEKAKYGDGLIKKWTQCVHNLIYHGRIISIYLSLIMKTNVIIT